MQAWIATAEDVRLSEVPEPTLKGGGVLVEVLAAHVPAYTNAVVRGNRGGLPVPLVLGPSCVGRVLAVAPDVFHVEPGDLVLDTALLDAGGGDEVLVGWVGLGGSGAGSERTDRMRAVWRDGVFAEKALCAKETLVKLPGAGTYPDPARLAFLPWLCIAASGLHAAGPVAGRDVAVVGATGQLGGAAVLTALAEGAATVTAVGRNEEALGRLAKLDPRVRTHRLTGDRATDAAGIGPVDVALDTLGATPSADATMAAYDSLRVRGTLVLVGGVRQDLPVPYGDLMHRRLTLRGSWMSDQDTVTTVWNLVRSGVLDLAAVELLTAGLADPAAALDLAERTTGLGFVALVP
ncbi:D-arabinose 1-dehydrogenase, Zn-dependent alcohol dehydrogenase family [Amycolatopsis tolypomycina]|uniref:D-arabinose 1-dehydrogenase, Zn-dependent alcohol dehydrogenase family n=1 Tax=Amycolatopsis tolypomycina TaxID=208445 RepID=A0A1H4IGJ5_9PSEU|nr:zinc-binding dehydrogenase [Amycolatopsis tolypomycina]SEB33100.1 D-arabinose 1-dehydrogenase, Zn-dependent alcohol dehydrogenase family [Amycolatopsis tolypomycina]